MAAPAKFPPPWLLTITVMVVTAVWVGSFVAHVLDPSVTFPPELNAAFGTVIGTLFASAALRRNGGS